MPTSRTSSHAIAYQRRNRHVLELLEGRQLLATFSPSLFSDGVTGNTLRAAVIAANANGQDNTIILGQGQYMLTLANTAGQENMAYKGDLDLTSAGHTITICGAGMGSTFINGNAIDRVLQIFPGVSVVLKNLTITKGQARDAGVAGQKPGAGNALGGGILNQGGSLTLSGVMINRNVAQGAAPTSGLISPSAQGGGIWTNTSLSIECSTITLNQAIGVNGVSVNQVNANGVAGDASGGGIYASAGTISARSVSVDHNTASGGAGAAGSNGLANSYGGYAGFGAGGGIYCASLQMSDSVVMNNSVIGGTGGNGGTISSQFGESLSSRGGSAQGGGLYVFETAHTVNTRTASNTATGGAGGTLANAPSVAHGGDGGRADGGGIYFTGSILCVSDGSAVSGNVVTGGAGGYGHRAVDSGGGGSVSGAGVACRTLGATITFTCVTVTVNRATGGTSAYFGDASPAQALGGGIAVGDWNAIGGMDATNALLLDQTAVTYNTATGGAGVLGRNAPASGATIGGNGGNAAGGGIYLYAGTATFTCSTTEHNTAQGGNGGNGVLNTAGRGGIGGNASGGGIWATGSMLTFKGFSLCDNAALGGNGGKGASVTNSIGGRGGDAGDAIGGGISVAEFPNKRMPHTATFSNVNIYNNMAVGGGGGDGGSATGLNVGTTGGAAGNGGSAEGGGINSDWTPITLTDTCVTKNKANGGRGGRGGWGPHYWQDGAGGNGGNAYGGGIHVNVESDLVIDETDTIYANTVLMGVGGYGTPRGSYGVALGPDIDVGLHVL